MLVEPLGKEPLGKILQEWKTKRNKEEGKTLQFDLETFNKITDEKGSFSFEEGTDDYQTCSELVEEIKTQVGKLEQLADAKIETNFDDYQKVANLLNQLTPKLKKHLGDDGQSAVQSFQDRFNKVKSQQKILEGVDSILKAPVGRRSGWLSWLRRGVSKKEAKKPKPGPT